MIKVSILKRKATNGLTYLYLGYYPYLTNPVTQKQVRSESLHIYMYSDPKNSYQKEHNKSIMEIADYRRSCRIIELARNEYKIFDKNRLKMDFLEYFTQKIQKKSRTWFNARDRFSMNMKGNCSFGDLNLKTCEGFREYLLHDSMICLPGGAGFSKDRHLSQNTAAKHFIEFRNILKQAYQDGFIPEDINVHLKNIPYVNNRREFLTREEMKRLYETPCKYDVLKRACMFSVFSGLRLGDIVKLEWKHIVTGPDGQPCIRKII